MTRRIGIAVSVVLAVVLAASTSFAGKMDLQLRMLLDEPAAGKAMLGKSPEKAEKLIKKQNRSCLTVDEGIALCVHTNVLSEHYVDCTGSRYWHADRVPSVYLSVGRPRLNWNYFGYSNDWWGSASCRSRA